MPRLNGDQVKKVEETEGSSFRLMKPGTYWLRLTDVEATTSKANNPMWVWQFEVDEGEYAGTSLREHTVLSDKALWKIKQVFAGFGVTPDTHTDDLVGKTLRAVVDNETINQGKLKGELTNRIVDYVQASGSSGNAKVERKSDDGLPF